MDASTFPKLSKYFIPQGKWGWEKSHLIFNYGHDLFHLSTKRPDKGENTMETIGGHFIFQLSSPLGYFDFDFILLYTQKNNHNWWWITKKKMMASQKGTPASYSPFCRQNKLQTNTKTAKSFLFFFPVFQNQDGFQEILNIHRFLVFITISRSIFFSGSGYRTHTRRYWKFFGTAHFQKIWIYDKLVLAGLRNFHHGLLFLIFIYQFVIYISSFIG